MASEGHTVPKPSLQQGFRIRTELGAVCILVGRHDLQGGGQACPYSSVGRASPW
jgi:hypothetical protein